MAVFNPEVQKQQDPNYWYWSRSIQQPEFVAPTGNRQANTIPNTIADTSKGEALKGIGDIAGSAVKVADQYAQDSITNEAYNKASASQEAEKQRLKNVAGVVGEGNEGESLVEGDTQKDGPSSLRALPSTLASYDDARANGKMSQTYYYMMLDKQASDMRARYPGYRDYIDHTFEKVTGVKPANAVIHSLVADINAATAKVSSERNKALSLAQQYLGIPGMDSLIPKVQSGQASYADVIKLVSPVAQQQYQFEQHKVQRTEAGWNTEDVKRHDELFMRDDTSKSTANFMDTSTWDDGVRGPKSIKEILDDAAKGKIELTADQLVGLSASIKQQYNTLLTQQWTKYNKPNPDGSPSMGAGYGGEETAKLIKAQMLPLETLVNYIGAGDFKMADYVAKRNEAIQNDTLLGLLNNDKPITRTNPDGTKTTLGTFGQFVRTEAALAKSSPKLAQEVLTGWLHSDLAPSFGALVSEGGLRMAAGPDLRSAKNEPMGQVTPKVITDHVRENPSVTPKEVGRVVQHLAEDGAKFIQDATKPAANRINMAESYFSPNNMGTLKDVKQAGQRASLYATYTSPEMTKAVWELSRSKPELWEHYKEWATKTAALEIIPKDIDNLHQLQQNFLDVGRNTVKMQWDDENHRIGIDDGANRNVNLSPPRRDKDPHMYEASAAVNRMNIVVQSLVNIAKVQKVDPNAFVYHTLTALGADIGLVEGLKESIGKSGIKPKPRQGANEQ